VPEHPPAKPALLVSIHDVSPLTWAESAQAIELARTAGVPDEALSLLVIPRHEGTASLGDAPEFVKWLRGLTAHGVTLIAHGCTHRMPGRILSPYRALWAYLFANGEGEFYAADRGQARAWFDVVREEFSSVDLGQALAGFVPPAWLLSRAAAAELDDAGFAFVELMRGLRVRRRFYARRLIGWGQRSWMEALVTDVHARLQAARRPADTRLAIHPPNMRSQRCRRSIRHCLETLLGRLEPLSYADFVSRAPAA
jgi:uncharacterized protein